VLVVVQRLALVVQVVQVAAVAADTLEADVAAVQVLLVKVTQEAPVEAVMMALTAVVAEAVQVLLVTEAADITAAVAEQEQRLL
jgi:hypothetical protein